MCDNFNELFEKIKTTTQTNIEVSYYIIIYWRNREIFCSKLYSHKTKKINALQNANNKIYIENK